MFSNKFVIGLRSCRPNLSVIITSENKVDLRSTLIQSPLVMITDRIELHSVLLPLHINITITIITMTFKQCTYTINTALMLYDTAWTTQCISNLIIRSNSIAKPENLKNSFHKRKNTNLNSAQMNCHSNSIQYLSLVCLISILWV